MNKINKDKAGLWRQEIATVMIPLVVREKGDFAIRVELIGASDTWK